MEKKRPIHSIRRGAVEAAVWENNSDAGVYYRVTFSRVYSGPDGRPKNSDSFGRRETAAVALLAIQVESWIRETEKAAAKHAEEAQEVSHG